MSSAENGRPVRCLWLTEDMAICSGLRAAWQAAPADPAEAVQYAFEDVAVRDGYHATRDYVAAVLAALGVPQRPTPRDETPDG